VAWGARQARQCHLQSHCSSQGEAGRTKGNLAIHSHIRDADGATVLSQDNVDPAIWHRAAVDAFKEGNFAKSQAASLIALVTIQRFLMHTAEQNAKKEKT